METEKNKTESNDVKTSKHASRYLFIGITLAVFNYGLYIIANFIINNNNLLWLSSFIASAFTTILAFILHSKITWKERDPGKDGIYKFLIWNLLLTIALNPGLTQFFSLFSPIYNLAYNTFQSIHINLNYELIQSTGAFILTAIVTTILNFLFYDRFVFGKKKL
ncbi:GtrA family protein [Candidatus Saccharibacteria bacterium]|nr:GtrA family protein [Candidatus Saccharibacteria bacterium]